MPTCCSQNTIPFTGQAITTISYNSSFQDSYGPTPHVHIYYLDTETGEFYLSNAFFTRPSFKNNIITVDHGGPQTGYIVIR